MLIISWRRPFSLVIKLVVMMTVFLTSIQEAVSAGADQAPPPTTPCKNACGSITIDYPFGLEDGCGAPEYRAMLNCTPTGDLFFKTPTGGYRVRSINYDEQSMVIYDPGMSTCTMLQPHHDFAMSDPQWIMIPPSSDTVFALLNCSIDSPVLNHYRSLCFNFSGHSCDELYAACPPLRVFRSGPAGLSPPCCFTEYSTVKFMSMNILDCTHYTTFYDTDRTKGVGPLDWSYGIRLSYTVPNAGCQRCTKSGGVCGYNTETEGMVCICSGGASVNSTRDCGGALRGGGEGGGDGGGCITGTTLIHFFFTLIPALFSVM